MKTIGAIPLLVFGCCFAGCYSPQIDPNYAHRANERLSQVEKDPEQNGASEDQKQSMIRLWSDVPRYVEWLSTDRKMKHTPRLISASPPEYPWGPLMAGIKARVLISFVIDKTGKVEAARVLESSDSRFDEAACESIKKWRFLPAEFDTGPDIAVMAAPVEFAGKR